MKELILDCSVLGHRFRRDGEVSVCTRCGVIDVTDDGLTVKGRRPKVGTYTPDDSSSTPVVRVRFTKRYSFDGPVMKRAVDVEDV